MQTEERGGGGGGGGVHLELPARGVVEHAAVVGDLVEGKEQESHVHALNKGTEASHAGADAHTSEAVLCVAQSGCESTGQAGNASSSSRGRSTGEKVGRQRLYRRTSRNGRAIPWHRGRQSDGQRLAAGKSRNSTVRPWTTLEIGTRKLSRVQLGAYRRWGCPAHAGRRTSCKDRRTPCRIRRSGRRPRLLSPGQGTVSGWDHKDLWAACVRVCRGHGLASGP